jgi:acylpyruvate hydrolase
MRLICFQRHRYRALGAMLGTRLVDLAAAASAWLGIEHADPFFEQEVALRLPADIVRFLAGGVPSRALADAALAFASRTPVGIEGEPLFIDASEVRLLPIRAPLVLAGGARFRTSSGGESPAHREFFMRNALNTLPPCNVLHLPTWLGSEFAIAPRLAVVIGDRLQRASHAEAHAAIYGYCAAMDLCAQQLEKVSWAGPMFHVQYPHARNFDGSLILGSAVVSCDEAGEPDALTAQLSMDDERVYDGPLPGRWEDLVSWIAELSQVVTLQPGTLLIPGAAETTIVQPAASTSRPAELLTDSSVRLLRLRSGAKLTLRIAGFDSVTTRVA